MQVALQDIRVLGYRKLIGKYLEDKDVFFKNLIAINTAFYSMRVPPYSLLNKWGLLSDLSTQQVYGYSSFIYNLEPMISLEEPSNSSKRRCRNTWNSIWESFGFIAGLDESEITLINDFGLKLLFILASYTNSTNVELKKLCRGGTVDAGQLEFIEKYLDFYNAVLAWSVLVQQESNFTKSGLCFMDILWMLVVNNNSDFVKLLSRID